MARPTRAAHRFVASLLAGAVALTAVHPAHAADPAPASGPSTPASTTPSSSTRALAAGAALVPGLLLHGSGAYVLGKKTTAKKLAIAGGIGLVGTVASLTLIALTGASRRVIGPLAAAAVGSVGIFSASFASDLYAVLAPEGGTGEPLRAAPRTETRIGASGVYDPVFQHRALVDQRIDVRFGPMRVSGAGQFAPESTSRRLRAEGAVRLHGPTPAASRPARDGSFVDVEGALTDHAYVRDHFATTIGELSLRGRYDLARLDRALAGSFVEGQAGVPLLRDRYRRDARASNDSDVGSLLLARFAWGVYLGRPRAGGPAGEAFLFYDHRRDGYVGGMQPNGIGAGYLGSLGASGRLFVSRSWGVGADVQAGSAIIGGLSLLFRTGVDR